MAHHDTWSNNIKHYREHKLCFFCHGPLLRDNTIDVSLRIRNGACQSCDNELCGEQVEALDLEDGPRCVHCRALYPVGENGLCSQCDTPEPFIDYNW